MRFSWIQVLNIGVLLLVSVMITPLCTAEPTLQLLPTPPQVTLGKVFPLEVELSWQGKSDLYSSVSPTIELDEWAEVDSVSTTTSTSGDSHRIRHTLQIRPLQTGQFTLPDLLVAYFTPDLTATASEADTPPTPYPTLSAGAVNILVIEPSDSMLRMMGISLLFLLIGGVAWGMYRRNTLRIAQEPEYMEMTVPVMLHEAQKRRLDGNYYNFYQELLRGAGLLKDSSEKKQLQERYEELTLAVGYKGMVPEETELDGAMHELQRLHAREQGTKKE